MGIIISAATSKSGFSWFVTLFMLGFAGLMDWFLRRQTQSGKVFATVDASGITSPAFGGQYKRFEWKDVSEVTLSRVQNAPMLQLVLKASLERPDKRRFWTGTNAARPMLPMAALDQATQDKLFAAIGHHVQMGGFGDAPPKLDNQLTQENEFQDRLKSFAPVPWLTYGLIAVNSAIWLASLMHGAGVTVSPPDLMLRWGGNAASEVQRGEWWRMFSAMFLHSGLMHVTFNMLGLYSVGVTVERIYGHRLFALIYLGSGLLGSALSLHFSAQKAVSVGASGAVFGVAGALLVAMLQHRKQLPKSLGKQTLTSTGFFILYSLSQGLATPGIDNAAHIGGLFAGCLLAYILPERFDLEKFVQIYRGRALGGLLLVATATVGLTSVAPPAQVDQRGIAYFAEGMRKLDEVMQALQREAQKGKEGKLTEREIDERSRTVFAPRMRDVVATFNQAQLPHADPRQPLLNNAKRMSELLVESLAMESVVREGSSKPEPVDLQRAAVIEKEILDIAQHIAALSASMQTGKSR